VPYHAWRSIHPYAVSNAAWVIAAWKATNPPRVFQTNMKASHSTPSQTASAAVAYAMPGGGKKRSGTARNEEHHAAHRSGCPNTADCRRHTIAAAAVSVACARTAISRASDTGRHWST
jgi:hypothetical protein